MARLAFYCPTIFDGAAWHEGQALLVEDGRVAGLVAQAALPAGVPVTPLGGAVMAPGFVDLQVNGGGGVQFNDRPDVAAIAEICAAHARFGTTSLLPTLITDTPEVTAAAIAAAIAAARQGVPGFLGLHLEGPHLSLARKGAHDQALIRPMTGADVERLSAARAALPALLVTLAPENATPAQVAALTAAGVVVSLGHSDCTRDTAFAYAAAGARLVTHLFNAMSPLGHREPGLVGAALADGRLSCGLIADGIHVDPAAIGIALRAKQGPGALFLVTDAMATIGTDAAGFTLNGRRITRRDGRLTLDDGTLAGADVTMDQAIRVMTGPVGVPLATALAMASAIPAAAIGQGARKGRLAAGADADFVVLDADLGVVATAIGGRIVHAR